MKVKAMKTLNENIIKGNCYEIKTTKNGIKLLYWGKNYYLINDKQIADNFIIL